MSVEYIKIDGSVLEGGGQILRNALSLSCIFKIPIHINNIRAGRQKPGLAAQHLKGIHLVRDICNAQVKGDTIGSTTLLFNPQKIKSGKYYSDIGTAGSIALLLQVALPVLLFANDVSSLELKGGTNAEMAPQIDYITEIFRANLEKFGATFDFNLLKRGYFPKGGGHCEFTIKPIRYLNPCTIIDFGQVNKIFGWSFVAGTLPIKIAHDMTASATKVLSKYFNKINIETYKEDLLIAPGNCSGIILGCETTTGCILGSSALGSRQISSFEAGKTVALNLEHNLNEGACIDMFTQDQLIIFMALANGISKIKTLPLTLHTKTSIFIVESLIQVKFHIKDNCNGTNIIECAGIGFQNNLIN